jgi:glutamyl-tRNA reductase
VNELRVIALTHKNLPLENIGEFHLSDEKRNDVLAQIKANMGMEEIMFLSTCNRVEIIFTLPHFVCPGVTGQILHIIRPDLVAQDLLIPALNTNQFYGDEDVAKLKYVCNVNEDMEEDLDGAYVKFYAPEGHTVILFNIDLEYLEEVCS